MKRLTFKPFLRWIILGLLGILLFAGALRLAFFFATTWRVTPLASVPISVPDSTPSPDAPAQTPTVPAPADALPPAWDGASRVSILIMGLDYGDWSADRNGPSRTDSMILFTIDPQAKTAAIISIPRDLWVDVPGFGYNKINTAYFLGESYKLPGGGPALAVKTVEQLLGVPIQYYAQIDFYTFVDFIDAIGGIDVNVPKKIRLDPLGPGNVFILSAGPHHLDGMKALAFARNRHTKDGDIDRSRRQQLVIMAVRDKLLSPANFPTMMARAPQMYQSLQGGVRTNLSLEDVLRLTMLVDQIPRNDIQQVVIDYSMASLGMVVQNGQALSILQPIPGKIRELRDQIFLGEDAPGPLAKGSLLDLMGQENPTISLLNGSHTADLTDKTAAYFRSLGFTVVHEGTASQHSSVTRVVASRGLPYSLKYLQQLFNFTSSSQIIYSNAKDPQADLVILLGDDWAKKNPLP